MVSFFVIARNAEKYLLDVLGDILNQDYPKETMELILIDGESIDSTIELMNKFKDAHNEFKIKIFNNPKRILASGWNIALSSSSENIIIRVDAHSRIPSDFVRMNVKTIAEGHDIVGGTVIAEESSKHGLNLSILAELSQFGGSPASFRNPGQARYIDTLAYAAYKRSVFGTIGGYDERLVRTEDNEIHYRMKKAGFKFYYNPEIKSLHIPRGNLYALLKQKYSNGLWIGLTMGIQPKCFNLRHFMPLFFVLAISGLVLFGMVKHSWYLFIIIFGVYLVTALFFSFESMRKVKPNVKILCLGLPLLFFLMHFTYGLGTIIGLIKMPYFVWKNRNYKIPFPINPKSEENLND